MQIAKKGFISELARKQSSSSRRREGFTLIELLVVIVIIGILAAVVMLAINPAEMMRRGRDATRFDNLETVRKAVDLAVTELEGALPSGSGTSNAAGIPRECDGSPSWVANLNVCAYLSTLPIDPTNNATFFYEYNSNAVGYELGTKVESEKNFDKARNDGGSDNTCTAGVSGGGAGCWYEQGTDPGLDLIDHAL